MIEHDKFWKWGVAARDGDDGCSDGTDRLFLENELAVDSIRESGWGDLREDDFGRQIRDHGGLNLRILKTSAI